MREIEEHVITIRTGTATRADLARHGAGDDVARGEILDGRCVAFHEPFAVRVAQDGAFAARRLGQQNAEARESGGMELKELHVFQGQTLAPHNRQSVAGEGVCVRSRLVDLSEATRCENDRLGREDVDLSGSQLVGDDAGSSLVLGWFVGQQ